MHGINGRNCLNGKRDIHAGDIGLELIERRRADDRRGHERAAVDERQRELRWIDSVSLRDGDVTGTGRSLSRQVIATELLGYIAARPCGYDAAQILAGKIAATKGE